MRRRRAAGADRPGLRRQGQRRRRRRVRREGHPVMSMTQHAEPAVTTPPASGPQQTDGRTARRPLALRLLARPEVGRRSSAPSPCTSSSSIAAAAGARRQLDGERPLPVVDHRDHGAAGGAADDRRRVRPVGRRRGDHLGADREHAQLPADHERLGRRRSSRCWCRWRSAFFNGWMLVRTGLPSFLITLGTFLILQGVNLGGHQAGHRQRGDRRHQRHGRLRPGQGRSSPRRSTSAASR